MIAMRVLALVALAACGCASMRHPTELTTWGQPGGTTDAMVLGLEARGQTINVFLKNRSAHKQLIIAKGFTLTIAPAAGGAGAATQIVDATNIPIDRDETFEDLKPGESLATPMGVSKLPPGTYQVSVAYHPQGGGAWWTGSLTAGPITFVKQ
jgi:hypothetical protein